MNVCQDFVFKGIVDIQSNDTLTNIDGIKVPFKNAELLTPTMHQMVKCM